ncbi:MAG: hypothetical protein MJ056_01020 [Akkermansia sp.]|nr:hypothetical protein [Akkermansia sp.]
MKQDVNKISYAQKFISEALLLRNKRSNEQIIRANLCSYLPLMFDPTTKWVDDHIKGTEKAIHIAKDFGSSVGYIDNCIDATPIEYEKDLRIRSVYQEGYNQVKTYCAGMIQGGIDPSMILGILSDTLHWEVYAIEISKLDSTSTNDFQNSIPLKKIFELDITTASPDNARQLLEFLPRYLGREGGRTVCGANLAKDFGLNSKYSENYRKRLKQFVEYASTANSGYYDMIKKIWEDFVYQIDIELDYQECYVEEYYISILGKLLCANFLSKKAIISSNDELKNILLGSYFENFGYNNFAEYDYFGWLSQLDNIDEVLSIMHDIQHEFLVYNFALKPKSDLFGEILVELSTKQRRILLGQELTPLWLAHDMLERVEEMKDPALPNHYLDMCCGSGAFIIEALESAKANLRPDTPSQLVIKQVCEVITGFDIDPLAVILAKINWIISVDDVLKYYSISDIYIPIYHADSLFFTTPVTKSNLNQREFLQLRLYNKLIDLPTILISHENQLLFDEIIDTLYSKIYDTKLCKKDVLALVGEILSKYSFDDPRFLDQIFNFSYQLYKSLFELHSEGKNGIWAFLIKNAFRPNLIRGDFSAIISNTPWLAMSKIRDCPYKSRLMQMSEAYNIQPTGPSRPHLELATTFLIHAIDKYLVNDGVFACVLPHSILEGAQHEKLRQGNFKRNGHERLEITFSEIWDLPKTTFKNLAITLFGRKALKSTKNTIYGFTFDDSYQRFPTPFRVHKLRSRTSWALAKNLHDDSQVIADDYKFHEGADILPRHSSFFDLCDKGDKYCVTPISLQGNNAYLIKQQKIFIQFTLTRFLVSKKYFYPTLLSNLVLPFYIYGFANAYIPFTLRGNSLHELLDIEVTSMSKTDRNFYDYIQYIFRKYKNSSIYSAFNKMNKLKKQNLSTSGYMVVYCAGGARTCAAYLNLSLLNQCPIIDQTLYYHLTKTEDEAIYLVGLLNSPLLSDHISTFQSKGAFAERHVHTLPKAFIQQFDCSNELHQCVVEATRSLITDISAHKDIIDNIANPNKSLIQFRRTRFLAMLKNFKSYAFYSDACQNYFSQFSSR